MSDAFTIGESLHVRTPIAAMHGEPRISSAWTSQLLCGHVVQVLETHDAWLRVRGEDDYEGWMHSGYLAASTGVERSWRISLGCRVQSASGVQQALPLLARIAPDAQVVDGSFVHVEEREQYFPRTAAAIARSAQSLFEGASYVWGGVSPWGCDCSGFTQSIFALHGIPLPRDASQQAARSALDTGAAFDTMSPAALVYFSDRDDRRITHVGIMLGDGRMAHSGLTRGGFAVEDLTATDDAYVARLGRDYVGSSVFTSDDG